MYIIIHSGWNTCIVGHLANLIKTTLEARFIITDPKIILFDISHDVLHTCIPKFSPDCGGHFDCRPCWILGGLFNFNAYSYSWSWKLYIIIFSTTLNNYITFETQIPVQIVVYWRSFWMSAMLDLEEGCIFDAD